MPITGYVSKAMPLDVATSAWVATVVSYGGTVSLARSGVVDTLITGLKADGVWPKLDRLWLLAAENTFSALTDIVADKVAVANGSPSFVVDRGYTGVDSSGTVFIDTGFNPFPGGFNFQQDSAHISAWVNTDVPNSNVVAGCLTAFAAFTYVWPRFTDNLSYGGANDDNFNFGWSPSSKTGLMLINRPDASTMEAYHNTDAPTIDVHPSSSIADISNFILNANTRPLIVYGTSCQVAAAGWGGKLTATDVSNFYSRMRTYMTAVGVP